MGRGQGHSLGAVTIPGRYQQVLDKGGLSGSVGDEHALAERARCRQDRAKPPWLSNNLRDVILAAHNHARCAP
jgi:hypothetical protein